MKARKDKRLRKYDEESYSALIKYFLNYYQLYFPFYWGWMPSFYYMETPFSSNLSSETKERETCN